MRALELALRQQALVRRLRRPGPRPRVPVARFPRAAQLAYTRDMVALVDVVEALVRRDLLPRLPAILDAHRAGRPDAVDERIDMTGALTDEEVSRIKDTLGAAVPDRRIAMLAEDNALRVSEHGRGELQRQVNAVAKIDLFTSDAGLAQHIEAFVADNVRLIKSLPYTALDDVHGLVLRGARQGLRVEEVRKQIEARFGVARNRAALIARDQVGKLNGELAQLRQTQLGVRRYTWSTSRDERVRKGHRALEGTVQKWAQAPTVDSKGTRAHPGEDIQCRCQAVPVIDDVLEDAGLLERRLAPAPVRSTAGAAAGAAASSWLLGELEVVRARPAPGGGANGAEKVEVRAPDGSMHQAIWKSVENEDPGLRDGVKAGSYHAREAAMHELDLELGRAGAVVPPTVSRRLRGKRGSLQAFVKGALSTADALPELDAVGVVRMAQDPRLRRMFLLDLIGGNDDRHAGNVLWRLRKGRVPQAVAIDNGLSFPEGGPWRFIFALPGEDFARAMLRLDDTSVRELRGLRLPRLAALLRRHRGITKRQVRETLARVRALQNDPQQLATVPPGKHARDHTLEWLSKSPERRGLSAADLAEIDKLTGGER